MTKPTDEKTRACEIEAVLRERYPYAVCSLDYGDDPWRLLCMARLSAQTTDARVNTVSKALFDAFPDVYAMAAADVAEIEKYVHSCGVYRVKAQNLRDFSSIIVKKHGGKVPSTREELLALPGVGRKIANLMLGDVFGKPAIVTDTHCIRIAHRLGLTTSFDPLRTEKELSALIPEDLQSDFCHRLVLFGREICTARKPLCDGCPLGGLCNAAIQTRNEITI